MSPARIPRQVLTVSALCAGAVLPLLKRDGDGGGGWSRWEEGARPLVG